MSRAFLPHVITDDSALGGSVIERSLRFNDDDSPYLGRTPSGAGSNQMTFSFWIKRGNLGGTQAIFSSGAVNARAHLYFTSDDKLNCQPFNSSGANTNLVVDRVFRDTSAWYHVVLSFNNSSYNDTASTVNVYVNGVSASFTPSVTSTPTGGNRLNDAQAKRIGELAPDSGGHLDGYLAEFNFIDGQVLDPTYFGYTDFQTGLWRPKRYEGTYGTNGFHLEFKDNSSTSALGKDTSGNGNDWSVNNFSVSAGAGNDSLEDAPTNNFCTLNPLDHMGTVTVSNGNLNAVINGDNASLVTGSLGVSSGKWYYEAVADTAGAGFVGWIRLDVSSYTGYPYQQAGSLIYFANGSLYLNGAGGQSYGTSYGNGDVIGCAIDLDNNSVTFYKNNSSQGTVSIIAGTYHPNTCTGGSGATFTFNFGQRPFSYTPPAGHKTLNSKNLPPNVPSIIRPQKHFETLLYTGNGSTTQNITGLEFKPDFVWIKRRDTSTTAHHSLIDSVRGDVALNSNQAITEYSVGNFNINNNNSIDVPYYNTDYSMNTNSATYVAWCWKAGGAAVSNTNGNITSSVSVNEEAGFSIVSYTGNGSNGQTVGHGLSKAPQWIMLKSRTAGSNWRVWQHKLASDGSKRMLLDAQNASEDASFLNDTAPSSTVFTLGNSDNAWNVNSGTYIAYCWHEVPGFSKFGSYKGNGNADGPFVLTGFRPAVIMFKNASTATNWEIYDTKRQLDNPTLLNLYLNSSSSEETSSVVEIDILSDGFKIKTSWSEINNDNDTHIYMAFAEQPGTTPFDTFTNAR